MDKMGDESITVNDARGGRVEQQADCRESSAMAEDDFWDMKMPFAMYEHSQMYSDSQDSSHESFDLLQRHGSGDDSRVGRVRNNADTGENDSIGSIGSCGREFDFQAVLLLHMLTCVPSNRYVEGSNMHPVFPVCSVPVCG